MKVVPRWWWHACKRQRAAVRMQAARRGDRALTRAARARAYRWRACASIVDAAAVVGCCCCWPPTV